MTQLGPAYVIVNPASAYGKTRQRWPAVEKALRAHGLDFTATFSERRRHAELLARQAASEGYRLLVAVGGEGTLLEMVNGLAGVDGRVSPDLTLGVLPSGTGSDFARFLGIPRDPVAAVARLTGEETTTLDLGVVECAPFVSAGAEASAEGPQGTVKRYFLNVAGLGFDGEVVERVESRPKPVGGTIPYLYNLFLSLVTYRNKDVTVQYNGRILSARFNSVIAANGAYFGGGMFVAPNASANDGLFELVLLGDLNKAEVVANLPRLYKGTHITHPKVTVLRAREIQASARQRALIQADGELVGLSPATFRIIPQALRMKV
jgi:YegS/Rv2252/BmrU family lipid kinase